MEREIVVRGQGEARCLPDRAVVGVTLEARSSSRDGAYQEAAATAKQVDDAIEGRRSALGRVTTAALVVQPTTRWRKGEVSNTGWRAARTTRLEVTGFEQLGELMAELAGAGADISGPKWEIDAANPVHRDARRAAAEDARRRAEDYAAALGLGLDGVAWITEPGLGAAPLTGSVRALAAARVPPSPEAHEVIDVTPEELTIEATVEVGFSLGGGPPGASS